MARVSRLALVAAVALAAGALAGCSSGSASDGAGATTSTTVEDPTIVPGPGQAFVTGDVTRFVAESADVAEPLTSPFTLTAVQRGSGSATIDRALVAGKRTTISWGTGTPLPITGDGGLELGAVRVEVDATGMALGLDGTWSFRPGTYRAGAPVAVGSGGIAASRDTVEFTADSQTVLNVTGGVVVRRDPRRVELKGPGKLAISGRLDVQTPDAKRSAGTVTFGPGPFTVTLVPASGRVTMASVIQGPFQAA